MNRILSSLNIILGFTFGLFMREIRNENQLYKSESIADLSDSQVIALTELEMEPLQDARLSELLDKQQSGNIASEEPQELEYLMQIYREGLLCKATALVEAVKCELMEPLSL